MKHGFWLIGPAMLVIALSACSPQESLSLTPEEDNLPVCADLSTVLVENLATDRTDCALTGASLTFPDGVEVPIDEFAGSGMRTDNKSDYTYHFVNVGNFGFVASRANSGCVEREVWGSAEGQRRVFEAFGDEWPCEE